MENKLIEKKDTNQMPLKLVDPLSHERDSKKDSEIMQILSHKHQCIAFIPIVVINRMKKTQN
jgi:hypothetical protein